MAASVLMRVLAGATLLLFVFAPTGCKDDCGDVACPDPESLYVELPTSVPAGAAVELCFEGECASADMTSPTDGFVPWSEVGTWSDRKDDAVEVSVSLGDTELSRESVVADHRSDCCGDNWTVRLD